MIATSASPATSQMFFKKRKKEEKTPVEEMKQGLQGQSNAQRLNDIEDNFNKMKLSAHLERLQ